MRAAWGNTPGYPLAALFVCGWLFCENATFHDPQPTITPQQQQKKIFFYFKWGEVNILLYFLQVLSQTGFTLNSLITQQLILVKNIDFTPQMINWLGTSFPFMWNQRQKLLQRHGEGFWAFKKFCPNSVHSNDQSFTMYFIIFFNSLVEVFLFIFIYLSHQTSIIYTSHLPTKIKKFLYTYK